MVLKGPVDAGVGTIHRTDFGPALAVALLLASIAGCSAEGSGVAQSAFASGATSASSSTSVLSQQGPISVFMDPCKLISAEELSDYGDFEPKYEEGEAGRSCYWQESASGGGDVFTFALSLRDAQSVETVQDNGAGVQRIEVNQRPAAVSKNAEFRSVWLR
jgi:hypothetical protein